MWNYVDLITLSCHTLIFVLRVATVIKGGAEYHNRLLEVVNFFYGVNTLFLVLRFSSIMELNKTAGPLQLALFKMIVDLITILVQFAFVIMAFSAAITMILIRLRILIRLYLMMILGIFPGILLKTRTTSTMPCLRGIKCFRRLLINTHQ